MGCGSETNSTATSQTDGGVMAAARVEHDLRQDAAYIADKALTSAMQSSCNSDEEWCRITSYNCYVEDMGELGVLTNMAMDALREYFGERARRDYETCMFEETAAHARDPKNYETALLQTGLFAMGTNVQVGTAPFPTASSTGSGVSVPGVSVALAAGATLGMLARYAWDHWTLAWVGGTVASDFDCFLDSAERFYVCYCTVVLEGGETQRCIDPTDYANKPAAGATCGCNM